MVLSCGWCGGFCFFLNLNGLEMKRDKQHVLSVVGVGGRGNAGINRSKWPRMEK